MGGWKTKLGTAVIALGTVLRTIPQFFPGQQEVGEALIGLGAAITGYGIAHKIEKKG